MMASGTSKIAFLFPGGGTQYVGMGKKFYQEHKIFRQTFEMASDLAHLDLSSLAFYRDIDSLSELNHSFPAIVTFGYSMFRLVDEEFGIKPDYVAGHSLGEYTALLASESIDLKTCLDLVGFRANLFMSAGQRMPGRMIAVSKLDFHTVDEVCSQLDKDAAIAVHNSETQFVVAAAARSVNLLSDAFKRKGGEVDILQVNTASHSPVMENESFELLNACSNLLFGEFRMRVMSNVTARPYDNPQVIPELLKKHMTHPVLWKDAMHYLCDQGVDRMIDLGPQSRMGELLHHLRLPIEVLSLENHEHFKKIEDRRHVVSKVFDRFLGDCFRVVVTSQNFSNDASQYSRDVVGTYERLQQLRLSSNIHQMNVEKELYNSLSLTKKILIGKKLSNDDVDAEVASLALRLQSYLTQL